jgi:hypothetical protein
MRPPVAIEYLGGPMDGQRDAFSAADLSLLGDLPEAVELPRGGFLDRDVALGRYVKTRKLTKGGRLIYEYRRGGGEP